MNWGDIPGQHESAACWQSAPPNRRAARTKQKKPDVSVDTKKFDEARRAGQTVKSAIGIGVALARYRIT
jgi:hypothetical protein